MKLCLKCLEELFDNDVICPKCNTSESIMDNEELSFIKADIDSCGSMKLKKKVKEYRYLRVFEYLKLKDTRDSLHPKILNSNSDIPVNPSYKNGRVIGSEVKAVVTCPYCQSTNTKKISGTGRWLSTGVFGLASSKLGKNFHCNNCKADF